MCEPTRETWLPVVGWEGLYEVSDLGRVRRIFLPPYEGYRVLRLHPDGYGYPSVGLSGRGKKARPKVHKLVAEAFLGPRPPGLEICHNDGDKTNAVPSNLRYDTRIANESDKRLHGTHHHSRKTHCPKGHEYTSENTFINRRGGRECRTCKRARTVAALQAAKEARALNRQPHYNTAKTHCPQGHEYTPENTYINPKSGGRMCRTCMSERRNKAKRSAA